MTVDRYRVAGKIPGIEQPVLEYHETEYGATTRLHELDDVVKIKASDIKVEKVSVTEEEADAHPARSLRSEYADQIPF